jgi:FixJ family two-component response regulator
VSDARPLVALVDDDVSVRESLPALIRQLGFSVEAFESAADLLASDRYGEIRCLIVDVEMPGMSGLEVLHKVKHRGYAIPIVFVSGHGGEALRRRLLEEGATECLFKPLSSAALVGAIEMALRKD